MPAWMKSLPRKRRRKWQRQLIRNQPEELCDQEIEGSNTRDGDDMEFPDVCSNCGGAVDSDAMWDAFMQARENEADYYEDDDR